jgi:uncharacterized membrane protein YbhN (UPF0104 family)
VIFRRLRWSRAASWALAIAALAFVVWAVPVHDRCWDPGAPLSTKLSVSRDDSGCTLLLRTGDVRIAREDCARLKCEPGVAFTFAHARPGVLAALLGLYGLGTIAWAARWRALLGCAGIDLPLQTVWRMSIEAQTAGILLPGGIGGDALRIASMAARPTRAGESGSPLTIVVASVLLDRAVGLAVLSALAAALGFAWGGMHPGPLAFALAAVPLAFLAGIAIVRMVPIERSGWFADSRIGRTIEPARQYLRAPVAPRAIAMAAALSVLVAGVQLATIRGLIYALAQTPAAEKWVYVGSAMAFVAAAIPALPGGWGTADAAYVFFLGLAGISAGAALGVCLMYRLFWYVFAVVGAVFHVARARARALA